MEQNEIFSLMREFSASSLSLLELDGARVRMEKQVPAASVAPLAAPAVAPAAAPEQTAKETAVSDAYAVKAPLVGVFYASPAPDAPPFVKLGDRVQKGQPLCVLEAMKMMNEMACPTDGIITKIAAENGDAISFGQLLFEVSP